MVVDGTPTKLRMNQPNDIESETAAFVAEQAEVEWLASSMVVGYDPNQGQILYSDISTGEIIHKWDLNADRFVCECPEHPKPKHVPY